jgi:hypothetical protein
MACDVIDQLLDDFDSSKDGRLDKMELGNLLQVRDCFQGTHSLPETSTKILLSFDFFWHIPNEFARMLYAPIFFVLVLWRVPC